MQPLFLFGRNGLQHNKETTSWVHACIVLVMYQSSHSENIPWILYRTCSKKVASFTDCHLCKQIPDEIGRHGDRLDFVPVRRLKCIRTKRGQSSKAVWANCRREYSARRVSGLCRSQIVRPHRLCRRICLRDMVKCQPILSGHLKHCSYRLSLQEWCVPSPRCCVHTVER